MKNMLKNLPSYLSHEAIVLFFVALKCIIGSWSNRTPSINIPGVSRVGSEALKNFAGHLVKGDNFCRQEVI